MMGAASPVLLGRSQVPEPNAAKLLGVHSAKYFDGWGWTNCRGRAASGPARASRGSGAGMVKLPVLHPDGPLRTLWDMLILLLFFSDMFFIMFEWAFLPETSAPEVVAWTVASNILWLVDMLMNACTGYMCTDTCVVALSQPRAIQTYMRTWFAIDFMSTIPPMLVNVVLARCSESKQQSKSTGVGMLRLLKFMRLFRAAKLSGARRELVRFERRLQSQVIICTLCLLQIFAVFASFSHLAACCLWVLSQYLVRTATSEHEAQGAWIMGRPDILENATVWDQYTASLHLAVGIVSGLGLQSYRTMHPVEECTFCCCYLCALCLMGVLVNEIAAMYTKLNETDKASNLALVAAENFMNWYNVPAALQSRVQRYLAMFFKHKEHVEIRARLEEWLHGGASAPAHAGLMAELNLAIFQGCMAAHPQLSMLPSHGDAAMLVASLFEVGFLPPGESLVQLGQRPDRLICIRHGTVAVNGDYSEVSRNCKRHAGAENMATQETLKGGDLIFCRRLLLPLTDPTSCCCSCTSFCEVSSLDFAKFDAEMEMRHPSELRMLRANAAIEFDSTEWLSWALLPCGRGEDTLIIQNQENLLHSCARFGSVQCIRWLSSGPGSSLLAAAHGVTEWRKLLEQEDADRRTPLELARQARQKGAVDAFVMLGASVKVPLAAPRYRQRWLHRLQRSREQQSGSSFEENQSYSQQESELHGRLIKAGIDLSTWGSNSFADLAAELRSGRCACLEAADGRLVRVLEVVRLRVTAHLSQGSFTLSETEKASWLAPAGLLRLPMRQMASDLQSTLHEIWTCCLGLQLQDMQRLERGAELVYEEVKESQTYPGLNCVYIVHEIPFWASIPESPEEFLGLPSGRCFEVLEPAQSETPGRRHVYTWLPEQVDISILNRISRKVPESVGRRPSLVQKLKHMSGLQEEKRTDLSSLFIAELEAGLSVFLQEEHCGTPHSFGLVRVRRVARIRAGFEEVDTSCRTLCLLRRAKALPSMVMRQGRLEEALEEMWLQADIPREVSTFWRRASTRVFEVEWSLADAAPELALLRTLLRTIDVVHEVSFELSAANFAPLAAGWEWGPGSEEYDPAETCAGLEHGVWDPIEARASNIIEVRRATAVLPSMSTQSSMSKSL